jgi:type I restriction enzyme S subunit
LPFEVPESWVWVKLGEICDYGKCNSVKSSEISNNAWVLDLEDIEKDTAKLLQRTRKKDRITTSVRHSFVKGDVLYSKLRTYLNKVIVADIDGFCTTEILPLDFKGFIVPEYARRVLMSQMFLDYTAQCGYGVKMPRLSTNDGQKALFPLPSFNEQRRIVSVIESAFALIDEIEENKLSLEQIIRQAKSKVLDLAIHGKLVPQDPDDESASALLERIRNECKTKKTTTDISHYPFDVPEGWVWTRLGEICKIKGGRRIPKGKSFSERKTNHIYIRVTDMKNNTIQSDNIKYIGHGLNPLKTLSGVRK